MIVWPEGGRLGSDEPMLACDELSSLEDGAFFYPCSGTDLPLPLRMFLPYCSEFWFVDTCYFAHQSPELYKPVLSLSGEFVLKDVLIHLPDLAKSEWEKDQKYGFRPPAIRTEVYYQEGTRRIVKVHRHRRRGPSAMRKQVDTISVFFYRGDSDEGGSATEWLTVYGGRRPNRRRKRERLIDEVFNKLVGGGLIVTDGSMCRGEHNPYREFRRLRGEQTISNRDAMMAVQPFVDHEGRQFRCIGCLGQHHHYGPTMVWKVTKNNV